MIRAMRNQEIITSPTGRGFYRMLVACQPVCVVVSLERIGLIQCFPKPSLQGDRIGLQSALTRWTRSRIEVNSDSLKSTGIGAGWETPSLRVVSWLPAKVAQIIPPAIVRSSASERLNSLGMGKSRDANSGKPPKLNDVCYRLWLRESLWRSEQIKPSVVYIS